MSVEENKALVRRLGNEFLNGRNLDVAGEIFAEDFVDHQGALGPTGDCDSVKAFVTRPWEAFPDLQFEEAHLVAEGDLVFAHLIAQGTHRGDFAGVAATGRTVSVAAMSVVRIADGKIVERWNITDFPALMRQITAPEAP